MSINSAHFTYCLSRNRSRLSYCRTSPMILPADPTLYDRTNRWIRINAMRYWSPWWVPAKSYGWGNRIRSRLGNDDRNSHHDDQTRTLRHGAQTERLIYNSLDGGTIQNLESWHQFVRKIPRFRGILRRHPFVPQRILLALVSIRATVPTHVLFAGSDYQPCRFCGTPRRPLKRLFSAGHPQQFSSARSASHATEQFEQHLTKNMDRCWDLGPAKLWWMSVFFSSATTRHLSECRSLIWFFFPIHSFAHQSAQDDPISKHGRTPHPYPQDFRTRQCSRWCDLVQIYSS